MKNVTKERIRHAFKGIWMIEGQLDKWSRSHEVEDGYIVTNSLYVLNAKEEVRVVDFAVHIPKDEPLNLSVVFTNAKHYVKKLNLEYTIKGLCYWNLLKELNSWKMKKSDLPKWYKVSNKQLHKVYDSK